MQRFNLIQIKHSDRISTEFVEKLIMKKSTDNNKA